MEIVKLTLPAARKNKNMTQKDLATFCGVSESTVSNWENGRSEPTLSQAYMVGKAVGMNIDNIIFLVPHTVKP